MKKRKVFMLLLIVIFLTGCDVEYEANISNNTYKENTIIRTEKNKNEQYNGTSLKKLLQSNVGAYIPAYYNPDNYDEFDGNYQQGVEYYNIESYETNSYIGLEAKYEFDFYDLYRSKAIKECFPEVTIQKNENIYKMNTNGGCLAFKNYSLLNNLTINITVDYKVIASNADNIEGNTYSWYFTKENASEKNISLLFNTVEEDLSDFDPTNVPKESPIKEWANENQGLVLIICLLSFSACILIIVIYNKRR